MNNNNIHKEYVFYSLNLIQRRIIHWHGPLLCYTRIPFFPLKWSHISCFRLSDTRKGKRRNQMRVKIKRGNFAIAISTHFFVRVMEPGRFGDVTNRFQKAEDKCKIMTVLTAMVRKFLSKDFYHKSIRRTSYVLLLLPESARKSLVARPTQQATEARSRTFLVSTSWTASCQFLRRLDQLIVQRHSTTSCCSSFC